MPECYTRLLETYAAMQIQAHTRKWLQHQRHRHQVRVLKHDAVSTIAHVSDGRFSAPWRKIQLMPCPPRR